MNLAKPSRFDEPLPGSQDPLLYSLVYCSRATSGVFQWIEGPRAEVLGLMDLIKVDSRHETVVVLSTSEEVRERIFPNWDMELVDTNDIRDVLTDALDTATDKKSIAALTLLLTHLSEQDLMGHKH